MVAKAINLAMRGLQFFWTLLVLALDGHIIAMADNGNPAVINYVIFAAIFAMLSLIYLIPATAKEGLMGSSIIMIALDALNTLFFFVGGVAMAAELKVHSCGNQAYLNRNKITNGAEDMSERCREAQAVTAFLWFGFAAFAASAVLSGLQSRGSANVGGIRRSGLRK